MLSRVSGVSEIDSGSLICGKGSYFTTKFHLNHDPVFCQALNVCQRLIGGGGHGVCVFEEDEKG